MLLRSLFEDSPIQSSFYEVKFTWLADDLLNNRTVRSGLFNSGATLADCVGSMWRIRVYLLEPLEDWLSGAMRKLRLEGEPIRGFSIKKIEHLTDA